MWSYRATLDQENHNEHYTYFLTDNAVEYQKSKPQGKIDKRLYMEHDESVMNMIRDFYAGEPLGTGL